MIEITKVTVKLGDKEISFTLEEARELHGALDDLLGKHKDVLIPYTPPSYPTYPYYYCGPVSGGGTYCFN